MKRQASLNLLTLNAKPIIKIPKTTANQPIIHTTASAPAPGRANNKTPKATASAPLRPISHPSSRTLRSSIAPRCVAPFQ